jgi:hypothetical protein
MTVFSFGQPEGGICQMAFIVPEIRAAMNAYTRSLGAGPWFFMEGAEIQNARYRGNPMTFKGNMACANVGHMMIELIQQQNTEPSVFTEVIHARGYGLHHQAIAVKDFDAQVAAYRARGYEIAFECVTGIPNRVAYFDSKGEFPFFIEVLEATQMLERVFLGVYQHAARWDGTNPVRTFASFDEIAAPRGSIPT